jgi:outer membrane protein TolC
MLLAVAGMLGGCAAPTQPEPQALGFEVPAAWSGNGAAAASPPTAPSALTHWWLRFDDPLLTQLVNQALVANPSVAGAQATLRQAQALRDVAAAALSPTLSVSASVQRSEAGSGSTATRGNTYSTGLSAAWSPDLSGGLRLALAATDATALASAATLGDVQVAVAGEVALAYITLRSGQARVAIAQANLSNQLETLQITRWRQQAGLLTVLDTEQARAAAEQTRAAAEQTRAAAEQTRALLPPLQTGVRQASHAIAALVGLPPGGPLNEELKSQYRQAIGTDLVDISSPEGRTSSAAGSTTAATGTGGATAAGLAHRVPQASADITLALPAATLLQRPSVVAARYQLDVAQARLAQARVAGLPSTKLSGSLGLNAATLASLSSSAALLRAVLASINWPLLDGGATSSQARAQGAAWQQAQQTYKSAVLTTLQEVEDQLAALQGDRERLQRLAAAADAATQSATLARQRYDSGLADFQTVLETQRNRLTTQDGVATAQAAISADQVRLFRALGGGWVPGLPNSASALPPSVPAELGTPAPAPTPTAPS